MQKPKHLPPLQSVRSELLDMITREVVTATTKKPLDIIKRPVLSILIATIEKRKDLLTALMAELHKQIEAVPDLVEVLVVSDNGEAKIGSKRQALLYQSQGHYVCFVDDDDWVSPDYIQQLTNALRSKPDAVGFCARRFINGEHVGQNRHSMQYRDWCYIGDDKRVGQRTIMHLNPVKRELAMQAGFPPIGWGEDRHYAARLLPLLKSQVFIDEELYVYNYDNTKTTWANDVWVNYHHHIGNYNQTALTALPPIGIPAGIPARPVHAK